MLLSELLSKKAAFHALNIPHIDRTLLAENLQEKKEQLAEIQIIKSGIMKHADLLTYSYNHSNTSHFWFAQDENKTVVHISASASELNYSSSGRMNAEQWRLFFESVEKSYQKTIDFIQALIDAG